MEIKEISEKNFQVPAPNWSEDLRNYDEALLEKLFQTDFIKQHFIKEVAGQNYFKLNNWKRLFYIMTIGTLAIQSMKIVLDQLLIGNS